VLLLPACFLLLSVGMLLLPAGVMLLPSGMPLPPACALELPASTCCGGCRCCCLL
jgi:hypothetical protein